MKSLIIYAAIILGTVFLTYLAFHSKKKNMTYVFSTAAILFPSIFAALRYNIGTDYQIHQQVFNEIAQGVPISKRAEIGYVFLNKAVILLGGNYNCLLFLVSVISISCIFYTIYYFRNTINTSIAMLAYMLLYYQMSYNFIRQLLAASIAVLAMVLFMQNRRILPVVICCIAATFHITALIYIPVILLYTFFTEDKYKVPRLFVFAVLTVLVFAYPILLMPLLEQIQEWIPQLRYFINYLAVEYKALGIGLFRYILLFIVPGFLFYGKMEKKVRFCFNTAVLGFIMWLTSYVTKMEFYRISYNYLLLLVVLIGYFWEHADVVLDAVKVPKAISRLPFYEYRGLALKVGLLFLLFFFWYYDYFHLGAHETVPYMSILGGG